MAAAMAVALRFQFRTVMGSLEDEIVAVADVLLERNLAQMVAAAEPILRSTYLASAAQSFDAGLGIEWVTLTDHGAVWASDYSFSLVRGINATTRSRLQAEVATALEEGLSTLELRNRLAPIFGPIRAEAIAVTETTRAAVEGQHQWVEELTQLGISVITSWITAGDARVCEICAPLDGQVRMLIGYIHPAGQIFFSPPAHTRCRCSELMEPVGE
jgi:hypothetical protein